MKGIPARIESHEEVGLTELIGSACLEAKGKDLTILDVSGVSDIADYFVFVSGRSDRQVQGIGNKILEATSQSGLKPTSMEGFDTGHWLLLDYDDVVVHVFYEPLREHYDLESLWARGNPVELDNAA